MSIFQIPDLLIFALPAAVLLLIALAVVSYRLEKKRREALAAEAASLGLHFAAGKNYATAEAYRFLNVLHEGENRYADNLVLGTFDDQEVRCFDFHYETHSTDSKGHRTTHHHWHHVYLLSLPRPFPELTIGPENIFTRLAKNFGYASIDFESHEFSRRFLVRSRDKKFAYDVCHSRMMEYLLANRDLTIEIEGQVYATIFNGKRQPGFLRGELERLLVLRRLMPEYLFRS